MPPAFPDKQCPYCAEDIRFEAIKCKHCGEFMDEARKAREEEHSRNESRKAHESKCSTVPSWYPKKLTALSVARAGAYGFAIAFGAWVAIVLAPLWLLLFVGFWLSIGLENTVHRTKRLFRRIAQAVTV